MATTVGLEQTFFLLEEELLEPVYTIYQNLDLLEDDQLLGPEVVEQERSLFERAIFARTTQIAAGADALEFSDRRTTARQESESVGASYRDPQSGGTTRVNYRSPFSLADGSFRDKRELVSQKRVQGLSTCRSAWLSAGVGVAVALLGGFAFAFPRIFGLMCGIGGTLVLLVAALVLLLMKIESPLVSRLETAMADGAFSAEGSDAGSALEDSMPNEMAMLQRSTAAEPPRVREDFPETLFWEPQLITDDLGVARLTVPLADSITTWRLSLTAVDTQGRLGASEESMLAYQPFQVDMDLPVALRRGDEVEIPIVVYNYTSDVQQVELTVESADWFEPVTTTSFDSALTIEPGQVRSVGYRIRTRSVGKHQLVVQAIGQTGQDAVRRNVRVEPDGRRVVHTTSGMLNRPFQWDVEVPDDVIEGSLTGVLRFYPSTFSQLVEGLDAIFQRPSGCFEQTSSTTYPNVLALDYLRRNGMSNVQIEAKAKQYIHLGYQRLLTFEIPGGGFDWYGSSPASVPLTAYGLLEFKDMAKVHDVDPNLIQRTENWLLSKRSGDGAWRDNRRGQAGFVSSASDEQTQDLLLTAAVAWSVYEGEEDPVKSRPTVDFLLAHPAGTLDDPYVLAMMINALVSMDPSLREIDDYAARLESLCVVDEETLDAHWERDNNQMTMLNGRGLGGQVELTALSTIALLRSGNGSQTASRALQWIVSQKDEHGMWYSTQATILALKALLMSRDASQEIAEDRTYLVAVDGMQAQRLTISPDQSEVVQQLVLTEAFEVSGPHSLQLTDESGYPATFRFELAYHVPDESIVTTEEEPLSIQVDYDKTTLVVNDLVGVRVEVVNQTAQVAPMVMLELPIPAGFKVNTEALDAMVQSETIGKYQLTSREIIVYLRYLDVAAPLILNYELRATMPVQLSVPEAEVYEYYDPARRAFGGGTQVVVNPA